MSILDSESSYTDPDEQLRELLERQHLILEMEATPGFKLWRDFLAAEAQGYQNRLLKGRHTDMLGYRYDAGFCEGIRTAIGASDQLAARIAAARELLAPLSPTQEEDDVEALANR